MSDKKRRSFSIVEKVKIIERLESGATIKDLHQELQMSQSTLSTIWKSKDQLKSLFEKNITSNKRFKRSHHQDVEQALLKWFKIQRSKNIPINSSILQDKATEFGNLFNKPDFQCTASWISRFCHRHNIIFSKTSGSEATSIIPTGVPENWLEHVWPKLRANYEDDDIYHADETGLFFRLTPDKTSHYKGKTCYRGNLSTERLTVLVTSNITGSDKVKLLVIGNSKTPRCFKNIKDLPACYNSNHKAWMTGNIFSEWLKNWDYQLAKENRKILLTVDNCPAHSSVQNLEFIKLIFLPPNTTSLLEPVDQGVIKALKVQYRKQLVLKTINREEQGKNTTISLVDAILMLSDAWNDVSPTTIKNYFLQTGFQTEVNQEIETEASDDNLETGCLNFPKEMFQSFVEVDASLWTSDEPSDDEIVTSVLHGNEEKSDEAEETVFKIPSLSEVFFSIDQVRTFVSVNSAINTPEVSRALKSIEKFVKTCYITQTANKLI